MLPHVVRFNAANGSIARDAYRTVLGMDAGALAERLGQMLEVGRLRSRLSDHDIPETALPALAADAAKQWTATFNPRAVTENDLLSLYQEAM
jgi:alcohol dehydrogenase